MRDLYERLGLGFGADDAALRRALARIESDDAELARRVRGVLLDPQRRAAYDAVYRSARGLRDWRLELLMEDGAWAQRLSDSDLVRPDLPVTPLPAAAVLAKGASLWARLQAWWCPRASRTP